MGKTFGFGVPLLHRITTASERAADRYAPRAGHRAHPRTVPAGHQRPGRRGQAPHQRRPQAGHRVHLRRPALRGTDRGAAQTASTSSSAPPAGCSTWPSRAICSSAGLSAAGARRGRRDARPGLPARYRAHSEPGPGRSADDAVLGHHAGPDHHPGPHIPDPADAHPRRGAAFVRRPRHHRAVRLPRARAGQGRDWSAACCRPRAAARR